METCGHHCNLSTPEIRKWEATVTSFRRLPITVSHPRPPSKKKKKKITEGSGAPKKIPNLPEMFSTSRRRITNGQQHSVQCQDFRVRFLYGFYLPAESSSLLSKRFPALWAGLHTMMQAASSFMNRGSLVTRKLWSDPSTWGHLRVLSRWNSHQPVELSELRVWLYDCRHLCCFYFCIELYQHI